MKTRYFALWFVMAALLFNACSSQSGRDRQAAPAQGKDAATEAPSSPGTPPGANLEAPLKTTPETYPPALGKVIFFLENSESMFGYVSGISRYVGVVSELA